MRALALAFLVLGFPDSANAQACASDPALTRAAETLIDAPRPPDAAELLEAARAAGADAPVVDALIIRDGDVERRDRFLARVAARRGAAMACGEARRTDRWLILAAPRAAHLELLPNGALRVTLAPGWVEPRLFARDALGRVWQRSVRSGAEIVLPDELAPPVDAQLVAEGPRGPRPLAVLRLGGGAAHMVPDSDEPILARLARLRERGQHGALRDNRLLARVAEAHADEVCADGRVAHVTDGVDPRERLARAGLRARHVGEVIARVDDLGRAYGALLQSPSHRAALIDPRFTDVGIGTAESAGRTCVVVLLAAWPRAVPY